MRPSRSAFGAGWPEPGRELPRRSSSSRPEKPRKITNSANMAKHCLKRRPTDPKMTPKGAKGAQICFQDTKEKGHRLSKNAKLE